MNYFIKGFAFTSPVIIATYINKKLFSSFMYQADKKKEYLSFLEKEDKRKKIIFVLSLADIRYVLDTNGFDGILVFDDIANLKQIQNIEILDVYGNHKKFVKRLITPERVNYSLLQNNGTTYNVVSYNNTLSTCITFIDLIDNVRDHLTYNSAIDKEVYSLLDLYKNKLLTKKMWRKCYNKLVKIKTLPIRLVIELEKFLVIMYFKR